MMKKSQGKHIPHRGTDIKDFWAEKMFNDFYYQIIPHFPQQLEERYKIICVCVCVCVCAFFQYWELNSGLHVC
jgi:hypothetical protein